MAPDKHNELPDPGAEDRDPDVAGEDERIVQARAEQTEKVSRFLDELAQLSRSYGLYLEGPGKDVLVLEVVDKSKITDCAYLVMFGDGGQPFPIYVCWSPESTEGKVDIDDVGT